MSKRQTIILTGKPAAPGTGMGPARILQNERETVLPSKITPDEISCQLEKFNRALRTLKKEYKAIKELPANKDVHHIIRAQIHTLDDPEVQAGIIRKIEKTLVTAEYAIFSEFNNYIQLLEATDVNWAEERVVDLISIRDELIEITRDKKSKLNVKKGDIVFADDIAPALMVTLSQSKIGGVVIKKGGITSHAVILSQSLGIPCVINATWDRFQLQPDFVTIIDGDTGRVLLNPDSNQIKAYRAQKKRQIEGLHEKLEWAKQPSATRCGHRFLLKANVEFLDELPRIKSNGAEGIGLFRTETVLFETQEFDVENQIAFYSKVVEAAGEDPITIRLFDAGGDKIVDLMESEDNPFLGWRGVRMLLDQSELLKKQLEAIYRTSGKFKNRMEILIPMVSHAEEVERVKNVCEEIKSKLKREKIPFNENLPIGVMVEVPSVAIMADHYAGMVDFFSIGTNDLTQYTLAVDRGNEKISDIFDDNHPALWRLIKMTLDAARKHNIPVSVCGEMASRPESAACLIGMGFQELSMNSSAIPTVKHILSMHTLENLNQLSRNVLGSSTTSEVRQHFEDWLALQK